MEHEIIKLILYYCIVHAPCGSGEFLMKTLIHRRNTFLCVIMISVSVIFPSCASLFQGRGSQALPFIKQLQPGAEQSGSVQVTGSHLYSLKIEGPRDVVIEAKADQGSQIDPVVMILNAEGQRVAMDDDGGGGTTARISRRMEQGHYLVVVFGYGRTSGAYRIALNATAAQGQTPGQPQTQTPTAVTERQPESFTIQPGQSRTAVLGPGGRHQYTMTLQNRAMVVINAEKTPTSTVDTILELSDVSGASLVRDDDGGEGLNARITRFLQPGTYTITVNGYRESSGEYRLSVQGSEGRSLVIGQAMTGSAGQNERMPYILEIASAGLYVIDLERGRDSALDPMLELQSAAGQMIASDDDGGSDLNARLTYYFEPGTYLVFARGADRQAGSFSIIARASTQPLQPFQTIEPGITREGWITPRQKHLYTMTIKKETLVMIDGMRKGASLIDPYLTLEEMSGKMIVEDDDSGGMRNARIVKRVLPGGYRVAINGLGDTSGRYALSLREVKTESLALGAAKTGKLDPGGMSVFRLSIDREKLVIIDFERHENSPLDPFITLKNQRDEVLASDDDSGGNSNARIMKSLGPGTYSIYASGYNMSGGAYRIIASEVRPLSIAIGESKTGRVSPQQVHTYEFTVTGEDEYVIELFKEGDSTIDPFLVLQHQAGGDLATDDDSAGNLNSRITRRLQPGRYRIIARGLGMSSGAYRLTLRSSAQSVQVQQQESQSVVSAGQPVAGVLNNANQRDSYTFVVREAASFVIRAKKAAGSMLDTFLELYDEQGRMIASNDDGGTDNNAVIVQALQPGRYRVVVRAYGNSTGGYVLSVLGTGR